MTVEGIFAPSADTEQGALVHKRVDRPSAAAPPPTPDEDGEADEGGEAPESGADRPRTVRSLALTSERLGLTGKLDLAEIEGQRAVPVEYRKGRPRRSAQPVEPTDEMMEEPHRGPEPEPWPTDRVQLGLQVLLLEDAGYTVPDAYLYYAAEKLKLRVAVDDELRRVALAELEAARKTAADPRPPPLVNDPRCPRCSLQPICLPDEINHERLSVAADGEHRNEEVLTPRRMWPPRDDGIHVVVQREGVRVGVRAESVRVTDKEGALVREFPLANMESLAVLGGVQVSTQALAVFTQHDVPVAFLSAGGRLVALMDPLGPTSAAVRAAQVRILDRPDKALELARAVTLAKISNQRTLLMRNHAGLPPRVASGLDDSLQAAAQASTMDELRGHEGNAAAIYFTNFAGMLTLISRLDAVARSALALQWPLMAVPLKEGSRDVYCLNWPYAALTIGPEVTFRTGRHINELIRNRMGRATGSRGAQEKLANTAELLDAMSEYSRIAEAREPLLCIDRVVATDKPSSWLGAFLDRYVSPE